MPRGFGSDNHATVHPQIMQAMSDANFEHAPSYGTDPLTETAQKMFSKLFEAPTISFFVFNGTGANVTALRALVEPWQSVICSEIAHIHVDECAAPEALGGIKLLPCKHQDGKLIPSEVEKLIVRKGDQHFAQVKAISITQPTELGTCYSLSELKELCSIAKKHGLKIHIDGARIANAVVHLQSSFKEMFVDLAVDVVCFGGTKNALMMGETVVFLNLAMAEDFKYIRKQSLQLPSKTRFIAAQFSAYLKNDLWKQIAKNSLERALQLYELVRNIPGVEVSFPPQSNAVFARIPQKWVKALRDEFFFYVWDEATFECRWMTSWDTTPEDVVHFAQAIQKLSKETP